MDRSDPDRVQVRVSAALEGRVGNCDEKAERPYEVVLLVGDDGRDPYPYELP